MLLPHIVVKQSWQRWAHAAAGALIVGLTACEPERDRHHGHAGDAPAPVADGAPQDAETPASDAAQPDAEPSVDADETRFAPLPGLADPARARRVGSEHYVFGRRLLSLSDGQSALYWTSYSDPTFSVSRHHLQVFSREGALLRESPLAGLDVDDVFLAGDRTLRGFHNHCAGQDGDVCFYSESSPVPEQVWSSSPRSGTRYHLGWDGEVTTTDGETFAPRSLHDIAATGAGYYALTRDGGYQLHALTGRFQPAWSKELLPAVYAPELPDHAPVSDLRRASDLTHQMASEMTVHEGAALVAFAVGRGTLAALNRQRGLSLPSPSDPLCTDILLVRGSLEGNLEYWVAPTADCERLPQLTVVDQHVFIASWVHRAKSPEPNDTREYDIGLSIIDLTTGSVQSRRVDLHEDDQVLGIAPCGERACLAGVTGARSVDTGSTVTYGEGFVLPVTKRGEPRSDRQLRLMSPRHSEIRLLVANPEGLLFFATTEGPITHTGDSDKWLGYNRGWLGAQHTF